MNIRPLTYGSLFSGVGGLDMGFDRAGYTCSWQCEFNAAAAGVLTLKWSDSSRPPRIFADMVAFRKFLESLSPHELDQYRVDVICGGSPCTNFSVAGLRAGLAGSESGLFREMVRICRILQPRCIVWENVIGAFSSCGGEDFAEVIGSFTGVRPLVPEDGWGWAGLARGLPGWWHVAWRSFNAQYFGVPQRRRRVFLVGSAAPADGSCVEILFEPESVRGHFAPGSEAGEEVESATGGRADGRGIAKMLNAKAGTRHNGGDENLVEVLIHPTLQANGKAAGSCTQQDAESGALVIAQTAPTLLGDQCGGCLGNDFDLNGGLIPTLTAKMAKGTGGRSGNECQNLVLALKGQEIAHTLRGEGFDASEDITKGMPRQVPSSLTKQCGQANDNGCGSNLPLIAFMQNQAGDDIAGEKMHSLATNGNATGRNSPNIAGPTIGVRRLTPVECERLMGWPDGHTSRMQPVKLTAENTWVAKDKPVKDQADGPRYRQCGNGVVSACSSWIAERMKKYARFEKLEAFDGAQAERSAA